jgi:preprotein translocase subunit SecF
MKNKQYLFLGIPLVASLIAISAIFAWGLTPGIDLAGGSMLQVSYEERPSVESVNEKLASLGYGEIRVQPSGDRDFILRQRELTNEEKVNLSSALGELGTFREVQFNSVGPSIGDEIVRKSYWAVALVSLAIVSFIAFAFRHVSKPVASWKYGLVTIVTLIHDVLIPIGLFAYLGHAHGAEIGVFFIVAILTTLGISINDTIVVFDRIRENLRINEMKHQGAAFADIVWRSTKQSLTRSVNTSATVVIVLVALYILGPESTKDFSLTLIIGMVAGTYSSLLLASPLLIFIEERQRKNAGK